MEYKYKFRSCSIPALRPIGNHEKLAWLLSAVMLLLLSSACSDEHITPDDVVANRPLAVAFDSYIQHPGENTRAVYPDVTTGGISENVGSIDNAKLRQTGFAVFSQYTQGDEFQENGTGGTSAFNFMWNQQVEWEEGNTRWIYAPVKYWPNDNQPADMDGAQGSRPHSYLSFFAYAPYLKEDKPESGFGYGSTGTPTVIEDEDYGIINLTTNSATAGTNSYVTYRLNESSLAPDDNIDLLWSRNTNLWKMKGSGEGYVNGRVKLMFVHALSKLQFKVCAVIDEAQPDDDASNYAEQYSHSLDENTKIFIERVEITSPQLYRQANMLIANDPNEEAVPTWTGYDKTVTPSVSGDLLHTDIKWEGEPTDPVSPTAATAKTTFDALKDGVTTTEHDLFATADDCLLVIPNSTSNEKLSVRVVYHVITYDEQLDLNTPKYFSIITNDITETATETTGFLFKPNKIYTIRLLLGLTTVKFTITADDWAVPITVSADVNDRHAETYEYVVE